MATSITRRLRLLIMGANFFALSTFSYGDTIASNITQDGGTFTNTSSTSLIIGASSLVTLSLQNEASTAGIQSLTVGNTKPNAKGRIEVLSGSHLDVNIGSYIGVFDGSTGIITVSGEGSKWEDAAVFVGGANSSTGGIGQILASDAGQINISTGISISYKGSLTVDGGTITNKGTFYNVGKLNIYNGEFIMDGGIFDTRPLLTIDGNNDSDLPILRFKNQSNGSMEHQSLLIGDGHRGSVVVSEGSKLNNSNVNLGINSGGNGTLTVTGENSSWETSGLTVGVYGTGTINILDGAHANLNGPTLGFYAGSVGIANISGTGTLLETSRIEVGKEGSGTLNITNGATTSAGGATVGSNELSAINILSGGQFTSENGVDIGKDIGQKGQMTISGIGSSVTTPNTIHVGLGGQGTLEVLNGGQVSADFSVNIGEASQQMNVAIVKDQGSIMNAMYLFVGKDGNGLLDVLDGGEVTSERTLIGTDLNSAGTVKLSGSGSKLTSTYYFAVGSLGSGKLDVLDGAKVLSARADIGAGLKSSGTANVSGHGSEMTSTTLLIGFESTGMLHILDGAKVTSQNLTAISNSTGGNGSVVVNGEGSTFVNNSLAVGGLGNGSLSILNGGTVLSSIAGVGSYPNTSSIATISGYGSTWVNTGIFYLGIYYPINAEFGNSDSLVVEHGGSLTVGDPQGLLIGWGGTLTGNDGTVVGNVFNDAGTVSPGSSPGIMTIDGNYTQQSYASLHIELAGLGQGTEYDYLHITGLTTLDGLLTIDILDGFEDSITPTDTFTILTSDGGITGEFSNLDLNHRLNVRQGSFLVSYEHNSVVLSDFVAVPEPGSLLLAAVAAVGFVVASGRLKGRVR